MRFIRENSLSLFFGTIFLLALFGQSVAGQRAVNDERAAHGEPLVSYSRYVRSSEFGEAVMENWQSEYLQFVLFIVATVWLVQRGSAESKPLEDAGLESAQKQLIGGYAQPNSPAWAKARGWRTTLYGNSLLLVMSAILLPAFMRGKRADVTRRGPSALTSICARMDAMASWSSFSVSPL